MLFFFEDKGNRSGGEKKVIMLRMLLGSAWISNKPRSTLTRPPCTATSCDDTDCMHDRHDSVIGYEHWNFREFVVYDPAQCYPEYIISYKRVT